jgi:uncharacterized protein YcbK (DUF882 family)
MYPYFTKEEIECPCGCSGVPKPELMNIIVTLREEAKFPFIVTSGFRCEEYNNKVKGSKSSPHILGLAIDIKVYGINARILVYLAILHNVAGIGIAQKGAMHKRYIHLDMATESLGYVRPSIWSY